MTEWQWPGCHSPGTAAVQCCCLQVSHRVVFPLELRLFNTSDDAVNPDRMYDLVAVVIHCGSGPNRYTSSGWSRQVFRQVDF